MSDAANKPIRGTRLIVTVTPKARRAAARLAKYSGMCSWYEVVISQLLCLGLVGVKPAGSPVRGNRLIVTVTPEARRTAEQLYKHLNKFSWYEIIASQLSCLGPITVKLASASGKNARKTRVSSARKPLTKSA